MVTFGEMLSRLSKLPHGAAVDEEVLSGYLNDRYQNMLGFHPWTRLNVQTQLVVPAMYNTGTVAITQGSMAIVLTGGTFTPAMDGFRLRISNGPEYYTFTYISGTTGTTDRAYEGTTQTEGAFRLWQAIFELADIVDFFKSIECPRLGIDLDQVSQAYLDQIDPGRKRDTGGPFMYAPYQDSEDGNAQIELYPGSDTAESLPISYRKTIDRFVYPDDTDETFPQWINTDVLFAGVEADLYMLQGDSGAKQIKEADWKEGLSEMVRQDNQRIAPEVIRMADRYTLHRKERAAGNQLLRQQRFNRM